MDRTNHKVLIRLDGDGQFVDNKRIAERVFRLVKEHTEQNIPIVPYKMAQDLGVDRSLIESAKCYYKFEKVFIDNHRNDLLLILAEITKAMFKPLLKIRQIKEEEIIKFFELFGGEISTYNTSHNKKIKVIVDGFLDGTIRSIKDIPEVKIDKYEAAKKEIEELKALTIHLALENNALKIKLDSLKELTIKGAPIIRNIFLEGEV